MKVFDNSHQTLISKKFCSMLIGGTLTWMVVSLLFMSDFIVAGLVIGSNAVAGITLVTPIYSLSAFFGSIFSIGVPVLYAAEMGRFDKKKADQAFGAGLLMSIIIGIILFLLINLFGEKYLNSYSPIEEVLFEARGYLYWMRFAILIMPIQTLLGAMVFSDGDEYISTIANIVQGVGNILLSIVLSKIIGIKGIALASFLFYLISVLILLTHFIKKSNSLRINLYFSFDILKKIIRYSIIDSSSYLFLAVFSAFLNAFISTQYGSEYLILASAIILCREFQVLFDGIGEAANPIFSVYVSERNHIGICATYALAKKAAIIEGIGVTILLIIVAPFVPQVLNVTNLTLAHYITIGIRLTSLNSVFISILYLLTSYYLVIGQVAFGLVVCMLRDVGVSIILIIILGGILNIVGLFIGITIAPATTYAGLLLYTFLHYGRRDCPLLLSKVQEFNNYYLFYINVKKEEIISMQRKIENILKEKNIDKWAIGQTILLIEEIYILISQMNNNKDVLAECTIFLHSDGIQIISKDDGVLFDMADEEISVKSLSAYTISMYLEKGDFENYNLTTMSFNRSSFFIKYKKRNE